VGSFISKLPWFEDVRMYLLVNK